MQQGLSLGVLTVAGLLTLAPPTAFGRTQGLATGNAVTCAVTTDRRLWCWGRNNAGQLGDGTTVERLWPKKVGEATGAFSRDDNVCMTLNGVARCAGANNLGQIGDGFNVERHSFTRVGPPEPSSVDFVTAGNTPCMKAGPLHIKCWGWNQFGAVGDGTTTDRSQPVPIADFEWTSLSSSGANGHSCAVSPRGIYNFQGGLWCWGNNADGALGAGSSIGSHSSIPVQVYGMDDNVSVRPHSVGVSVDHSCAVKIDGTLWCWGQNDHGQVGDGTTTPRPTPVQVSALGTEVTAVSVSPGGAFTCVVTERFTPGSGTYDQVKCWGRNDRGQLGDGTTTERHSPVQVPLPFNQVEQVSAGHDHACALERHTDRFFCWGGNDHGQVGDGTRTDRHSPRLIALASTPAAVPASGPAALTLLALLLVAAGWRARTR